MAKHKPKRTKSAEQLQEDKPFLGYHGGVPVIVVPWKGELRLESLLMDAAIEARDLGDFAELVMAMHTLKIAANCAVHVAAGEGVSA